MGKSDCLLALRGFSIVGNLALVLSEKIVIASCSVDPFAAGMVEFSLFPWEAQIGDCGLSGPMVRFWKENKCSH